MMRCLDFESVEFAPNPTPPFFLTLINITWKLIQHTASFAAALQCGDDLPRDLRDLARFVYRILRKCRGYASDASVCCAQIAGELQARAKFFYVF